MQSTFALHNSLIADNVEALRTALVTRGMPAKEIIRHTLTTEEILLVWQQKLGTDTICHLSLRKRFSRLHLHLRCAGAAVNPLPFDVEDTEREFLDAFGYNLLLHLGTKARYAYARGGNEVNVIMGQPRQHSQPLLLLAHMVAGIGIGLILYCFPWEPALLVNKEVVVPLLTLFSNFLCALLPFVVFFSICTSIVELTSMQQFYSLAGNTVSRFLLLNFLGAAVMGLASVLVLLPPLAADEHGGSIFCVTRDMLLALVPLNLITPFSTGNIPQVVFLAFLCGSIMLLLGAQVRSLKEQLQEINVLFMHLLTLLMKYIPLFIVGTIIQCFFSDFSSALNTAFVALALGLTVIPLLSVVCLCAAAWRSGRSPVAVVRQGLPSMIVAFCTMSSAAAFPVLMQDCKEGLRLPEKICNFGVPVALMLNKLPTAATFVVVTLACAVVFGVSLSLESLLMLVVQVSILCIAAPPVAGGALLVYAVLLKQCNIPEEALGFVAVLVLALDGMCAAMRTMIAQAVLMDVAGAEKPHECVK